MDTSIKKINITSKLIKMYLISTLIIRDAYTPKVKKLKEPKQGKPKSVDLSRSLEI